MDPIKPLIDALHAEGRLRIWSLVITVFGDSVQHRGGKVSSVRLQRLLGRVGVEPGALRTALSRLNREGWVKGVRSGRTSIYRLTANGQKHFVDATGHIYAAPRTAPVDQWEIAVGTQPEGLSVAPGVVLRPAGEQSAKNADIVVRGDLARLTAHARKRLLSRSHVTALGVLFSDLAALDGVDLDPLDAAAARTLLVHRWRRLVLRYPEVPAEVMPAGLPSVDPRAAVASAYQALTPAAEAWLDHAEGEMEAMAPPTQDIESRFRSGDEA